MNKHKGYNDTEFVTIGIKQRNAQGEIIFHYTTVDGQWFFEAVQELKDRQPDYIVKDKHA